MGASLTGDMGQYCPRHRQDDADSLLCGRRSPPRDNASSVSCWRVVGNGRAWYPENEKLLDWLRQEVPEEILQPDLRIVDPHLNLWDCRHFGDLPRPRMAAYLLPEASDDLKAGHNVVGTVFVECKAFVSKSKNPEFTGITEVEFAQGQAAIAEAGVHGPMARVAAGIIGSCDLRGDNVASVLEQMKRCRNFRGIRPAPGAIPKDLDQDASFRRGFDVLKSMDLLFEYRDPECANLPRVAELAKAYPGVTIVLNHLGGEVGPGMTQDAVAQWERDLQAVAQCPNVICKLGGILSPGNGFKFNERVSPPPSTELAEAMLPYFRHAIGMFTPQRCMFTSNFPSDKESASYRTLWNSFKRVSAELGLSQNDTAAIFETTATRVYRLDL